MRRWENILGFIFLYWTVFGDSDLRKTFVCFFTMKRLFLYGESEWVSVCVIRPKSKTQILRF